MGCGNRKPCVQKTCGCPVKGLETSCVQYEGDPLSCTGIATDQPLEQVLEQLDEAICEKFDALSGIMSLLNIGGGAEVFKQTNNLGQKEIRTIESSDNTLKVEQTTDTIDLKVDLVSDTIYVENLGNGSIRLETPPPFFDAGGVPRFIVNNLYQGTDEQGTVAKPYKQLQTAIDAFVGTGTPSNPQYQGGIIVIQKGLNYLFTGNLAYAGINLVLEEGVQLTHNPSVGEWFMDLDPLGDITCDNSVTVGANAQIILLQNGFRSRGVPTASTNYKTISLQGDSAGTIRQSKDYDPTYVILESNFENTPGFKTGTTAGAINVNNIRLSSAETSIWRWGGVSVMFIRNATLRAGSSASTPRDVNFIGFQQTGGSIDIQNSTVNINSSVPTKGFVQNKTPGVINSLRIDRSLIQPQFIEDLFIETTPDGGSDYSDLEVNFSTTRYGSINNIFKPTTKQWTNVTFRDNIFIVGSVSSDVDLTKGNTISVSNHIGNGLSEHLVQYESRAAAVLGGVKIYDKFLNTNGGGLPSTWFIDIVL